MTLSMLAYITVYAYFVNFESTTGQIVLIYFSFAGDSQMSCSHFSKVNSQNFAKMQQMDTPGEI